MESTRNTSSVVMPSTVRPPRCGNTNRSSVAIQSRACFVSSPSALSVFEVRAGELGECRDATRPPALDLRIQPVARHAPIVERRLARLRKRHHRVGPKPQFLPAPVDRDPLLPDLRAPWRHEQEQPLSVEHPPRLDRGLHRPIGQGRMQAPPPALLRRRVHRLTFHPSFNEPLTDRKLLLNDTLTATIMHETIANDMERNSPPGVRTRLA